MAEAKLPINLEKIGRYKIIRPLSKGGMALVFEARRESLAGVSPRVAIKLILPEHAGSATFREMFINEARLGAQTLVGTVLKGRTTYAGRLSAIIRVGHIIGPPLTGAAWDCRSSS